MFLLACLFQDLPYSSVHTFILCLWMTSTVCPVLFEAWWNSTVCSTPIVGLSQRWGEGVPMLALWTSYKYLQYLLHPILRFLWGEIWFTRDKMFNHDIKKCELSQLMKMNLHSLSYTLTFTLSQKCVGQQLTAIGSHLWNRRARSQLPVKRADRELCPPRIPSFSQSITSSDSTSVLGTLHMSPQRSSLHSSGTRGTG